MLKLLEDWSVESNVTLTYDESRLIKGEISPSRSLDDEYWTNLIKMSFEKLNIKLIEDIFPGGTG